MQAWMLALGMVQWGFLTAVIANGKKRNAVPWFFAGAIGLFVGLVAVLLVDTPKRRVPIRHQLRAMLPQRKSAVSSDAVRGSKSLPTSAAVRTKAAFQA
jgi:hypothetical protein